MQTVFTGKPCKRGHIAERRAGNRDCLECVKLRHRDWYGANRAADLARKAKWVEENRDRKRATDAAYYEANGEKIRQQTSNYYTENRDKGLVDRRRYRKDNLERLRAYDAERHADNPERARIAARNRRAAKKRATGSYTADDVTDLLKAQHGRCAYCRADLRKLKYHVDHITALSRGGSNYRRNLQLTCPPCNLSKHAADPIEFAQRTGRLL